MNILHWNIEHWWCSGGNSKVSDSNPIRAFLTRVLEFIGVGKGYGGGGGLNSPPKTELTEKMLVACC